MVSTELIGQSTFVPQSMGAGINTSCHEINPIVSPDGKIIYFVRVNHPLNNYGAEDSQDIWFSELKEDGTWGDAQRMPYPFNLAKYNSIFSLSKGGSTILFNGVYKNGKWIKRGLSISTKNGDSYSDPEKLHVKRYSKKNKGVSSNAFLSDDGQTLLLNFTKKYNGKKLNIYVSGLKNGKWAKPKKISKSINKKRSVEAPFLSFDGNTLFFSGNKDEKKNFNIYYSHRLDESNRKWSEPKLLSDTINTPEWESYFKTNAKGSWAYFSSTRGVEHDADIYKVKLFEENPFVVIKGKVINSKTTIPLESTTSYSIFVNETIIDSFSINATTGEYKMKLPLGKKYTLKPVVQNFTAHIQEIDVTNQKEYIELEKNLLVDPLPYIVVEGDLLISNDNSRIPVSSLAKIYVDKKLVDSAIVDVNKARYKLLLPFGKAHTVEVVADGFTSNAQVLDYTEVKEFKKIEKSLYVSKIVLETSNLIVVSGKVINVKYNLPLDNTIGFEIHVDQIPSTTAVIDKSTSSYSISFPYGSRYSINASVPSYYPVYEIIDLTNEKSKTLSKDLHVAPLEVGQSVKLNNILFETGKATLKKVSFPELIKVATFLKENPSIKIEISGHTDNVGSADGNLRLSQGRAVSVANYIILSGVEKNRISAKGYGLTKPVASNTTTKGKALNRRVEFTIVEK
jgi:outer membrane protein OmpA-like peptidoglycan-associated protein